MKSSNTDILQNLIQRGIGYSISNTLLLNELDKIDSKIRKYIQRKFTPKTVLHPNLSDDEYFDTVITNLTRQILIRKEILQLMKTPHILSNVNFQEITKIAQIHLKELKP